MEMFLQNDTVRFHSRKEKFSISAGILKIKHVKEANLKAIVNIPYNKLGKMEIKVRHKKGKIMRFGMRQDIKAKIPMSPNLKLIHVIPDNKFHVYMIDTKHVKNREILAQSGIIKKIFLSVSNVNRDSVEIDYIRLHSKKGHYLKKPTGTDYETKNGEMRKVLFTHTPLTVTYDLELPVDDVFLGFGMGIIDDNDPVTFKILINGRKDIFSKRVISSSRWHDAKINMSAYAGKKIQITFAAESREGNIALWSNPLLYTPPKEKFNVIIVLEDALRADHMSCYGYNRETTPVKKRFAQKGVLFLNAFSQAPKTQASCLSLMTSLYPTATRPSLHENYLTLAEILRYSGFQTAAFIQNANAGPFVGLHQGYSFLFDSSYAHRARNLYTKQALEWIKNHNESNNFLYIHVLDPHAPYDPPEEFQHWYYQSLSGKNKQPENSRVDLDWMAAKEREGWAPRYDGEIKNNDFYFEFFLAGLKKLNALEHTLIIFMADHGEYFGEHKKWLHGPPNFIQVIKTPLMMVCPAKLPQNRIIHQPVQNLDIVPTILDLINIKKDNLLLAGDSLLPLIQRKEPGYWENRIIVSDERLNLPMTKKSWGWEYASIIYKHTHVLNSRTFPMRQFNYMQDKQEINVISVPDHSKKFYKDFISGLHENNIKIWRAITKGITTMTKYDPKTIEKLKTLGYIQ
jgi:arylsulfatase A-like enzyme